GPSLGAHAPHSTSAALLRAAKAWTRARGRPLAIHAAESLEETEFLLTGTGIWKEFLIERGKWVASWQAPGTTPVQYLKSLNLLDEKTLAVHLTRAKEEDLVLLKGHGTRIAICPRSNQFITGTLAPLPAMLRAGLEPALGTDSLASNRDLGLWGELEVLAQNFPEINPWEMLRMATINGAAALHLTDRTGDLAPGKKARMFFLPLESVKKKELASAVIHSGGLGLEWLD
ncbi:MAG: amidohydrolase family protein, partial [Deltaproteobacteria bacterium]|nr:amidohydrolase family protein [Deltaproteobacteria bacterium]